MTIPTFPALAGLAYPVLRRPNMATAKNRSINGKVNALQLMSYPYWSYELPYNFLRAASAFKEWQQLTAFFLSQGGAAKVFQYHDVDDDTATAQAFGIGDGVATEFQLVRALTGSSFSFVEPVYAPTISQITVAGTPTVAYTQSAGLVTFTAPPANGAALAWTGTFNWLARFDQDMQDFSKFADQFWNLGTIAFTTELL